LVNLDDLLDLATEIAFQKFSDTVHDAVSSAVNLYPVVTQHFSVLEIHEPQTCGPLNGTGIEQNSCHTGLALQLIEQF
jgi:hypothetical protein